MAYQFQFRRQWDAKWNTVWLMKLQVSTATNRTHFWTLNLSHEIQLTATSMSRVLVPQLKQKYLSKGYRATESKFRMVRAFARKVCDKILDLLVFQSGNSYLQCNTLPTQRSVCSSAWLQCFQSANKNAHKTNVDSAELGKCAQKQSYHGVPVPVPAPMECNQWLMKLQVSTATNRTHFWTLNLSHEIQLTATNMSRVLVPQLKQMSLKNLSKFTFS